MREVKTFQYQSHEFRSILNGENPLFVAKDVCEALELGDVESACRKLPDDEKGAETLRTLGGNQSMICVTEPGLYRLIFRSNKPEAEKFRRWVFHEVLPAIRKTGSYNLQECQADKTVDIRHFRNPLSPSGLDIRYTLDLSKIILNPKKRSLQLLQRLTGVELSDVVEELALAEDTTSSQFAINFIRACCATGEENTYVRLTELYKAYQQWFRTNGFPSARAVTNKGLAACLCDSGYEKGMRGGTTRFYGISLEREMTA